MKSLILRRLLATASGIAALMLVIVLATKFTGCGPGPNGGNGGEGDGGDVGPVIERGPLKNPPPEPKKVDNPERIRQNLRPGKTYVTHTKGTLFVRGEETDWGVRTVVTINYAFEARIDREIESNDGVTIREKRHFRDLRSLKVTTRIEDLRLELGEAGDFIHGALTLTNPKAGMAIGKGVHALDGVSLKPVLGALRWAGVAPEELAGLDKRVKAFTSVDALSGKSVRITYVDGKGVQKVEQLKGEITPAERDFHFASALLSDSLIIPNADIKIGLRWSVDGSNFVNMVDPSLLARTSGEVTLERAPDHLVGNEVCRHVTVVGGRIRFSDPDPKIGQTGHFDPRGSLYFSPSDKIIVKAKLEGKAQLDRFSKNHLLFESRMRAVPEIEILYTCRIVDSLKGGQP